MPPFVRGDHLSRVVAFVGGIGPPAKRVGKGSGASVRRLGPWPPLARLVSWYVEDTCIVYFTVDFAQGRIAAPAPRNKGLRPVLFHRPPFVCVLSSGRKGTSSERSTGDGKIGVGGEW